ncbi:PepSY domain-containing protein [Streptomyces sp. NEAU-YJ-81]|uniref:PepSY domain-containing protein n=1 Tax=Streptomyces sp. NEAU-YJ-81 TaxID=2820288 RepID=UPI001ABC5B1E|nr:PepSY domain-containing protein [Streptomyces sp. NEAU-YJ-81]MBO3676602.1 PepSY domain-containing protein [Streptomyces sp. NEAU-YJ-81]
MKRNIVIASVAAAALLTGGTAVAVAGTQSSSTGAPTTHAADAAGTTAGESFSDAAHASGTTARASFSDAAHAALKAVPGTLDSLDLDHGARTTWDAEILGKDGKWHEVTLDASNAKVLNQHIDRDTDAEDAAEAKALRNADVSATEAARKAASSGTVTSVEFDGDRTPVWEVETVKNHKERDLNVNAQSGKVTQAPSDDDGDDD